MPHKRLNGKKFHVEKKKINPKEKKNLIVETRRT